ESARAVAHPRRPLEETEVVILEDFKVRARGDDGVESRIQLDDRAAGRRWRLSDEADQSEPRQKNNAHTKSFHDLPRSHFRTTFAADAGHRDADRPAGACDGRMLQAVL